MVSDTKIGKPVHYKCLFGLTGPEGVYGRIVGHTDGAAELDGRVSMVEVATPAGTLLEHLGILHLRDLDEEGLAKLRKFEELATADGQELYGGRYTIEAANTSK